MFRLPGWIPGQGSWREDIFITFLAGAKLTSHLSVYAFAGQEVGMRLRIREMEPEDVRNCSSLAMTHPEERRRYGAFKTGRWTLWVSDPEGIGYPAWTADNKYVEYMNPQKCRRVKLGSSQPEDVFTLGTFSPYFTDFGPWNDNAADGSRMFTRDTSTDDIYALDLDLP